MVTDEAYHEIPSSKKTARVSKVTFRSGGTANTVEEDIVTVRITPATLLWAMHCLL
jgi:hypothetical protein